MLIFRQSGIAEVKDLETAGIGSESLTSTILWMVKLLCTSPVVPLVSICDATHLHSVPEPTLILV